MCVGLHARTSAVMAGRGREAVSPGGGQGEARKLASIDTYLLRVGVRIASSAPSLVLLLCVFHHAAHLAVNT